MFKFTTTKIYNLLVDLLPSLATVSSTAELTDEIKDHTTAQAQQVVIALKDWGGHNNAILLNKLDASRDLTANQLHSIHLRLEALKSHEEVAESLAHKLAETSETLASVRADYHALEDVNLSLQRQLTESNQAREAWKETYEAEAVNLSTMTNQLTELSKEYYVVLTDKNKALEALTSATAAYKDLELSYNSALTDLNDAKGWLADANRRHSGLTDDYRKLQAEYDKLQERYVNLQMQSQPMKLVSSPAPAPAPALQPLGFNMQELASELSKYLQPTVHTEQEVAAPQPAPTFESDSRVSAFSQLHGATYQGPIPPAAPPVPIPTPKAAQYEPSSAFLESADSGIQQAEIAPNTFVEVGSALTQLATAPVLLPSQRVRAEQLAMLQADGVFPLPTAANPFA